MTITEDLRTYVASLPSNQAFPKRKKVVPVGTPVTAFGASIHANIKGTVVADYVNMYLIKADDPTYALGSTNSIGEGTYFQIDTRYIKETK